MILHTDAQEALEALREKPMPLPQNKLPTSLRVFGRTANDQKPLSNSLLEGIYTYIHTQLRLIHFRADGNTRKKAVNQLYFPLIMLSVAGSNRKNVAIKFLCLSFSNLKLNS